MSENTKEVKKYSRYNVYSKFVTLSTANVSKGFPLTLHGIKASIRYHFRLSCIDFFLHRKTLMPAQNLDFWGRGSVAKSLWYQCNLIVVIFIPIPSKTVEQSVILLGWKRVSLDRVRSMRLTPRWLLQIYFCMWDWVGADEAIFRHFSSCQHRPIW